jgi:hypothetical protein
LISRSSLLASVAAKVVLFKNPLDIDACLCRRRKSGSDPNQVAQIVRITHCRESVTKSGT